MGARRTKRGKGQKHVRTLFPALERLESTARHEQAKKEAAFGHLPTEAASGHLPNNTSNTNCTASTKGAGTETTSNSKVTEQALGHRASQEVESGSSLVTISKTK